jgi:hypothetical protein
LLADELGRGFSFIGLFNGAPDLAERREEILREEFAKRTDANRGSGLLAAMQPWVPIAGSDRCCPFQAFYDFLLSRARPAGRLPPPGRGSGNTGARTDIPASAAALASRSS